jgi:hypothetical protein
MRENAENKKKSQRLMSAAIFFARALVTRFDAASTVRVGSR